MSVIVNTRDLILQASGVRATDVIGGPKLLLMAVDTPVFKVTSAGDGSPGSVNFTVTLVGLAGTPTFTTSPVVTLTGSGLTRSLSFANMPLVPVTVTATLVSAGVTYTAAQIINRVTDGSGGGTKGDTGLTGPAGASNAIAYLYQFSTVLPAAPTGTSTFTWATSVNSSYTGSDGWSTTVPSNPGSPGILLYVASKPITAASGIISSSVSYSGAAVGAVSANGANGGKGDQGTPGVKTARAVAYQWGLSAPTATGSAVYTWATASYDATPITGWTASKTAAPGTGYTLYEASVPLVDATGATTSSINWTSASIVGISYIGTNSSAAGAAGNSAAICYTLINGSTLNTTPLTFTAAGRSKPFTGTWGETRAWTDQPSSPVAGQAVFQSDGIYYPGTDQTIWNVPYLSNLKVGSLSAISAVLGQINSGTITLDTGSAIMGGQTGYGTGTGFFLGYSGGYKFSIGSSTNYFRWDGSALSIKGDIIGGTINIANNLVVNSLGNIIAYQLYGANSQFGNISNPTLASIRVTSTGSTNAIESSGPVSITSTLKVTGVTTTHGLVPETDNAYVCGFTGNAWNNIFSYSYLTVTSDARSKTDITDLTLGLDFIKKLRPVSYRMLVGINQEAQVSPAEFDSNGTKTKERVVRYDPQPGLRTHFGLIAQEVKLAVGAMDAAVWSMADKNDPNSQQALRYEGFIAPIIKSIQEIEARLTAAEQKLATL